MIRNFVFAAENISDVGQELLNLPKGSADFWKSGLNALLNNIAQVFVIAAVVAIIFLIILGGIKWATAGGDKEALASAQKTITAALIGIVIVFSAWAIMRLVNLFFGVGGGGGPGPGGCDVNKCPPVATGKIGCDEGGGCCGSFDIVGGGKCSEGCRDWEDCIAGNLGCASGTSCCIKTSNNDATCSNSSDCCSPRVCSPSTHKCVNP